MKDTKILLVNKMYHPDIGGIETIVKQYAECLSKSFDVTVLTSSGSKRLKIDFEYINGVNVAAIFSKIYLSGPGL